MNALKALSKTDNELRVGNYMALFGGRDIEGEHFTSETDFESVFTKTGKLDIDWEHGLGQRLDGEDSPGESEVLGYVDWKTAVVDKLGLWVERVLDRRNAYMKYLEVLIEAGALGNSTAAIPSEVKTNGNGEITKWPLYRDTLTVMPMEPRMMTSNVISAVKGLNISLLPAEENISDEETKALQARGRQVVKEIDDYFFKEAVDDALVKIAFDRPPTEKENLYEAAAIGAVNFYANTRIKSLPVRVTYAMPEHDDLGWVILGKVFGVDDHPKILLSAGREPVAEFKTFLHEVGHVLDRLEIGENDYYDYEYIKTGAREDRADFYAGLLKRVAFQKALIMFHGGDWRAEIKSISITRNLRALQSLG